MMLCIPADLEVAATRSITTFNQVPICEPIVCEPIVHEPIFDSRFTIVVLFVNGHFDGPFA